MPKYTFMCPKCGYFLQKGVKRSVKRLNCPKCPLASMERLLPKLNGNASISEVINKYTGQVQNQDQSIMVQERRAKYYWSIEVPRMVNSGTYGVDTMLQQGWIWFDDKKQMRIHTVPPNER